METDRFDLTKAIADVRAARVRACEVSRRLYRDAEEISALRAALISAADNARRRKVAKHETLTFAISTAEKISPANASAYEPALAEFVRAADLLEATLEAADGCEPRSALASHYGGKERIRTFADEFVRTCELAERVALRNGLIVWQLRSTLEFFAAV